MTLHFEYLRQKVVEIADVYLSILRKYFHHVCLDIAKVNVSLFPGLDVLIDFETILEI